MGSKIPCSVSYVGIRPRPGLDVSSYDMLRCRGKSFFTNGVCTHLRRCFPGIHLKSMELFLFFIFKFLFLMGKQISGSKGLDKKEHVAMEMTRR